jgi:hypothetical protein
MILRILAIGLLHAAPLLAQENQQQQAELMRQAWAQSTQPSISTVQPVYSRIISFDLPRPFVAIYRKQAPGGYIAEYVPDGETLDGWTQMITVTANFGVGSAAVDDAALANYIFGRHECQGKLYRDLGEVPSASSARQRVLVIGCDGAAPGAPGSERAAIAFLRDADHVWTVQFAQRVPPGGKAVLFDVDQSIARLAALNIRAFTEAEAGVPAPAK